VNPAKENPPTIRRENPVIPPEKPKKSHQNKKSQVFSKKARKSNFFDNPLFPIIIKKLKTPILNKIFNISPKTVQVFC
jgi:hypothetical protein